MRILYDYYLYFANRKQKNVRKNVFLFSAIYSLGLLFGDGRGSFFYLCNVLYAVGANFQPFAVYHFALKIDILSFDRFYIGMGTAGASRRAASAYITSFGHGFYSLICVGLTQTRVS